VPSVVHGRVVDRDFVDSVFTVDDDAPERDPEETGVIDLGSTFGWNG
jgi:hypothetical protein